MDCINVSQLYGHKQFADKLHAIVILIDWCHFGESRRVLAKFHRRFVDFYIKKRGENDCWSLEGFACARFDNLCPRMALSIKNHLEHHWEQIANGGHDDYNQVRGRKSWRRGNGVFSQDHHNDVLSQNDTIHNQLTNKSPVTTCSRMVKYVFVIVSH